jgi:GMP synthase (glutamine-hydrolysing)
MSFILGILETGLVPSPLDTQYRGYPQMFYQLLHQQGPTIEFKFYNVIDGQYPVNINECNAYLITGSKSNSFDEDPWIIALKDYIKTLYSQNKKMIGICFGHQIIAHTLGGTAAKSDKGWGVGVHSSKVIPNLNEPWLKDNVAHYELLVSHQDQVLKLPNNATRLASNDFCLNSAYFINNQVLCFQGHPEFTAKYARDLMGIRENVIEQTTFNKAIASFSTPTSHAQVARWIVDFVTST